MTDEGRMEEDRLRKYCEKFLAPLTNSVGNFSIHRSKIIQPSLVLEITQAYRDLTGFYK